MTALVIDGARLVDEPDGERHRTVIDGSVRSIDGPAGRTGLATIDGDGLSIAPGFVDLQINGGFGVDLARDPEAMWELGRRLPSTGVTAFQPTIVSSPARVRQDALDALGKRPRGYVGAEPIGLHFEGPILAPTRRGAHLAHHLRPADPELVRGWSRSAGVGMVTLAPELPHALDLVGELTSRGVTVALGHSDATDDEAVAAIQAGASFVTHLFNAMAPLHHREPGLAGAAVTDPRPTVGLIVDGVHLAPRAVALAWRMLGPERLVLVTDAVSAMGTTSGPQTLGASPVVSDGAAIRNDDGVLAGSALTMDDAIRNLVDWTGCRARDAVRCASATPAAAVGATGRGRVTAGSEGDVVLLDEDLSVAITICGGAVAHVAERAVDRVPDVLMEGSGRWRS